MQLTNGRSEASDHGAMHSMLPRTHASALQDGIGSGPKPTQLTVVATTTENCVAPCIGKSANISFDMIAGRHIPLNVAMPCQNMNLSRIEFSIIEF